MLLSDFFEIWEFPTYDINWPGPSPIRKFVCGHTLRLDKVRGANSGFTAVRQLGFRKVKATTAKRTIRRFFVRRIWPRKPGRQTERSRLTTSGTSTPKIRRPCPSSVSCGTANRARDSGPGKHKTAFFVARTLHGPYGHSCPTTFPGGQVRSCLSSVGCSQASRPVALAGLVIPSAPTLRLTVRKPINTGLTFLTAPASQSRMLPFGPRNTQFR